MSAPPNPDPLDSEEARAIPNEMMIFRSSQASSSSGVVKKVALKLTMARLKSRKSTSTPPTQGNGRKRMVLSPFPEDKQLRKKIDFGDESSPATDGPRCKGAIFPAISTHGPEGCSKNMEHEAEVASIEKNLEMGIVCYKPPNGDGVSPDSGDCAGDEEAVSHEEDTLLRQPWLKLDDPTNGNGVVVGENVNLPKMNLETKVLLESPLEPCHLEVSHVALAVGDHVKPKIDKILLLAQLNSVDQFVTMVAQPFLVGAPSHSRRLTNLCRTL